MSKDAAEKLKPPPRQLALVKAQANDLRLGVFERKNFLTDTVWKFLNAKLGHLWSEVWDELVEQFDVDSHLHSVICSEINRLVGRKIEIKDDERVVHVNGDEVGLWQDEVYVDPKTKRLCLVKAKVKVVKEWQPKVKVVTDNIRRLSDVDYLCKGQDDIWYHITYDRKPCEADFEEYSEHFGHFSWLSQRVNKLGYKIRKLGKKALKKYELQNGPDQLPHQVKK